MSLFEPRVNILPYEYPELLRFRDAIRSSYWVHDEYNYTGDVQDFKVSCTPSEQSIIQRTMLAIAQIELSVKTFWAEVYGYLPKPEIAEVGMTFAESEVRHQNAYAHLLKLLGIADEFERLTETPAIRERIEYLNAHLARDAYTAPCGGSALGRDSARGRDSAHGGDGALEGSADEVALAASPAPGATGATGGVHRGHAMTILLFSIFTEHVSLFSQFLIMMSFDKHEKRFKGIANAVEATSKEEQLHGLFGVKLIDMMRAERPEWFGAQFEREVTAACQSAYEAETKILDWIFEEGTLAFLPRPVVDAFLKDRFNRSLKNVDVAPLFEVDTALLAETKWFDEEILSTKDNDFFSKRETAYNKMTQSVTASDLFD